MSFRNVQIVPLKRTPAFRKLALATWVAPRDPEIYGTLEVDLTKAMEWRQKLLDHGGPKVSPLHMVSRALGLAMEKYPDLNGYVRFGKIYLRKSIDIFFQVMTPGKDGRTDLTGVRIGDVNKKSVGDIASEMSEQVQRAREKKDLHVQKTAGWMQWLPTFLVSWMLRFIAYVTFTLNLRMPGIPADPFGGCMISNIGALGLDSAFAPLVPYSRSPIVILLGAAGPRPVVVDGEIKIRQMIKLNSTIDHRFCDGALLARMVKVIKQVFDDPDTYFGAPDAPTC